MLAFQRDKRPQVISCRYKCTQAWCYRNRRVTSSFPKTKTLSIFKITQRSTLQFNTPQTHWSQWNTTHPINSLYKHWTLCRSTTSLTAIRSRLKCTPQPTGEPEISSGYTCTQLKILFSWLMNDTNMWLYSQLEVLEDWVRRVSWMSLASQLSWCSWITTWQ